MFKNDLNDNDIHGKELEDILDPEVNLEDVTLVDKSKLLSNESIDPLEKIEVDL